MLQQITDKKHHHGVLKTTTTTTLQASRQRSLYYTLISDFHSKNVHPDLVICQSVTNNAGRHRRRGCAIKRGFCQTLIPFGLTVYIEQKLWFCNQWRKREREEREREMKSVRRIGLSIPAVKFTERGFDKLQPVIARR